MSTPASRKVEDWKGITPAALAAPVEHIRKMYDEGVWKCSQLTEKLCFADLHADDNREDLAAYRTAFSTYREIIGPAAAQEFDRDHQVGTPPAIFHAFLQAMRAGIRSEVRRLFSELLEIAVAHSAILNDHPVDWATTHMSILILSNRHVVKLWVKSVCDKQDYSKAGKTEQEIEDFIYWKDWRALKLIYMQSSGNLPYSASLAWEREEEVMTEKLLESLSGRLIQFLGFDLDSLAGQAHVDLAKTGGPSRIVSAAKVDANSAEDADRRFAAMAIEEALKSVPEDERPHPKVGAVVVKDGRVLTKAHRGEHPKPKSHAEYIALEEKLSDDLVAGATIYTTLEPCTTRKHPKIPCARRIIDRRVACVVIGMLDPNPDISGKGWQLLREAGIKIRVFDHDLMQICEDLNREFIRVYRQRQISTTIPTTDNPAMMAARSLIDATRNIQKAAWSFFALHTQFGVAKAARDVAEEERQILHKLDAALTVFTQDYDIPADLSPIVQNELGNINIALVNLKAFSMTGQVADMEIATIQIQDACERIRIAAKPYAYRS